MNHKLRFCTQTAMVALLIGASAAAAHAQAAASDQIETVVVTGLKRATPLQTTPVAITSISAITLEQAHVQTVQDIVHLVPSFQATTQGDHGVITLTLRGIGNDTAKTEYADPEVAIFVDGIYSPRAEGATALLFDMDNIEVLRGPQGTLWGRNSTTGVVNMVTAKPTFGSEYGEVTVGGGSYDRISVRGAMNLPLSSDFAMRVAFAHEQHEGYVGYQDPYTQLPTVAAQRANYIASGASLVGGQLIGPFGTFTPINMENYVTKGPKYYAQDQSALRVSFLWAPTDHLTWNLSAEAFFDRGTLNMSLMQTPRPGQKLWSALVDTAPYLHRDVYSVRSRIDYDFNDYLSFSYIAGASKFSGSSTFDQDGGVNIPKDWTSSDGIWNVTHQEDRTDWSHYLSWSHEVQLKSSGSHTVDWLLGAYYGAEDNGMKFDIPLIAGTGEGMVSGWQGVYYQYKATVATEAVFGQATWNVTDDLHLTGGLRFTHDHRANDGGHGYNWNGSCNLYNPYPGPIGPWPQNPNGVMPNFGPTYNAAAPANASCWDPYDNTATYKGDKLTWLARADYQISKDFMVYASVATGYKSGGTQDQGALYGMETLTSYEIGSKSILFGGSVTWNNAAYYYEFEGYQLQQAITLYDSLGHDIGHMMGFWNADTLSRAEGIESELVARLTPDDTLQVSAAVQGTRIGHAVVGSNDYQNLPAAGCGSLGHCLNIYGHSMAHSPTFSAQIGYTHDFHLASGAIVQPRVNFHFETDSWLSFFHDNLPGGHQDEQLAYTRTDLGLRYMSASSKWYLEGYVQNLEDGNIKTSAGATGGNVYQAQYLPPRTWGVNLGYNF